MSWGQKVRGLGLSAILLGATPAFAQATHYDCDLVVAEASLGGVAAALQAVRYGVKTCLTSMTDWLGGQLTTQAVSAIDEPYHYMRSDAVMLKRYGKKEATGWTIKKSAYLAGGTYSDAPHTDEVLRTLQPVLNKIGGYTPCWVSKHCFAPSDGNRALMEILAPYIQSGKLTLIMEAVPKRVQMRGDQIATLELVQRHWTGQGSRPYGVRLSQEILDWYAETNSPRYTKQTITLSAKMFIDATETAELAVLSGAHYEQGTPQVGNTPAQPECVMAFVYPINVKSQVPDSRTLDFLGRYPDPNPKDKFNIVFNGQFKFWSDSPHSAKNGADSVFTYRQYKPGYTTMNWGTGGNDFSAMNLLTPPHNLANEMNNWQGGLNIQAMDAAESRSYAFSAWLAHQPEVTWNNRGISVEFKQDSPKNYFGTGTGLSKFPYIRETRRIRGFGGYQVPIDDIVTDNNELGLQGDDGYPDAAHYTRFSDSVGIGSYPVDTRPCPTGYIPDAPKHSVKRYQIPLRALVSENIPNLMVANKSLAVSQQANASYRVHPTEWNAGFGSGTAAAIALKAGQNAHEMMKTPGKISEVQRAIVAAGGRVLWFSNLIPSDLR